MVVSYGPGAGGRTGDGSLFLFLTLGGASLLFFPFSPLCAYEHAWGVMDKVHCVR